MNKDTVKGQTDEFIGAVKKQWADLTDDDLLKVEGDAQKLQGVIQKKYGLAREQAERDVAEWQSRNMKR